jgi:3-oxoacyl-[acyl-carrier protein] reductase
MLRLKVLFLLFFAVLNDGFGDEMKRLDNQVFMITGASKGIGRGIAKVFSKEGAKLVLVARNERELKELAAELEDAIYVVADVRSETEMAKAAVAALAKWGKIDGLIANAGIYPKVRLEEMTLQQWQETIDVNLNGAFISLKSVLPTMMKQKRGKIVVISSITGPVVAMAGFAHYGASKGGVEGLVRTAAIELAKHHINVNSIQPGNITSEGLSDLGDAHSQHHVRAIPWGRLGTSEEVAHLALFLASKESDYITGQGIVIDGGQTLPESHFLPY